MKRILFVALSLMLPLSVLAQDWKGMGRLMGKVSDPDGKPLPGASVTLDCSKRGGGTTLTTDKKGQWAYQGLAACDWAIDIKAEGFAVKSITVPMTSEQARMVPVDVKLAKLQGPPPELVAALKAGDEAFKAEKWEEARVNYEKLAAERPELAAGLNPRFARIYAGLKQPEKAIEFLQKTIDADPTNQQMKMVAATAALDAGLTDKAMVFLASIDDAGLRNGDGYYDVGITFLRKGDTANAVLYLTKSIAKDPKIVEAYYYRGLAQVGLGKLAEAKADMQKVLELDPAGPMGEKAKKALEGLPK